MRRADLGDGQGSRAGARGGLARAALASRDLLARAGLGGARWTMLARTVLLALAVVAATLVVFHPIVFSGYTFSQSLLVPAIEPRSGDAKSLPVMDPAAGACQDEPWLAFIAENLRHGDVTIVDMKNGLGAPFLESLQPGALYLLNPLLCLLDTRGPIFFDVFVLVHVAILVAGSYRLLSLYARPSIALSMAILVGLSGVTFEHLNMVNYRGFAWLPWMLEPAVRMARGDSRRFPRFQLVLATVASMTAGNVQDFLFSLGTTCSGFAIECWAWRRDALPPVRRAGAFAISLLAGLLIGGPAVWPYVVARGDADVMTAVTPERSIAGLDVDWLLPLAVPKITGIYPDMVRAGPYTSWMSSYATVGAFLVVVAVVVVARRRPLTTDGDAQGEIDAHRAIAAHADVAARGAPADLPRAHAHELLAPAERTALIAWLVFLAVALLKIRHVFLFDFVQWVPMLREILFTKYHHFVFMPLGIAGATAFEVLARETRETRRALLRRSTFVALALATIVGAHIALSPDWWVSDGLDPVSVRKLTIAHATSLAVLLASLALWRWWTPRAAWIFVPLFVVHGALLRPDGYTRRLAVYYRVPEASDGATIRELCAAPHGDATWDRGVRADGQAAAFFVQTSGDLRSIHPGTKLRFAGSGVREVVHVDQQQVGVWGPPLDPSRDGCPHPIEVVSPEDVAAPLLPPGTRVLTTLQANQNLYTGIESVCVFNPILNRRFATLFTKWLPTFDRACDLQVRHDDGGLTPRQLSALRLLGVRAIYGYELAKEFGVVRRDEHSFWLEGSLPRLFVLSEDDCTRLEREWRGVPLAKSVSDIRDAIGAREIPVEVGTRSLRFDLHEPIRGRLIANQAFARAWSFEGREGTPFCSLFPSWSIDLAPRNEGYAIEYWPRGLTPALWIAAFGIALATLALAWRVRR